MLRRPEVRWIVRAGNQRTSEAPLIAARLKAAAGTVRTGVRVAQQTPHDLADRSGAVFAARVAATATLLLPEEGRPAHQITVAAGRTPSANRLRSIQRCKLQLDWTEREFASILHTTQSTCARKAKVGAHYRASFASREFALQA